MSVVQWMAVSELPDHEVQSLPRHAATRMLGVWELRRLLEVAVCMPAAVQLLRLSHLQGPRLGSRARRAYLC